MYHTITTHDLQIRIDAINELCNLDLYLDHYAHVANPWRVMLDRSIVHSGSKKELYRYLIGCLEGINAYKRAHNL